MQSETSLVAQGFTEVKVQSRPTQDTQQGISPQIRIEYSGIQISADSAYPPDNLAILLKELVQYR